MNTVNFKRFEELSDKELDAVCLELWKEDATREMLVSDRLATCASEIPYFILEDWLGYALFYWKDGTLRWKFSA